MNAAMLPPSSPIAYPASSSPVRDTTTTTTTTTTKRPRPSDAPKPPRPRVLGGFLADDDSDSDDDTPEQPSPKRRMLHQDTPQDNPQDTLRDAQDAQVEQTPPNPPAPAQDLISTPPDSQPTEEETAEEVERYQRLFGNQGLPTLAAFTSRDPRPTPYQIKTCSGVHIPVAERKPTPPVSYATMAAARSRTKEGRAHKSYYGIAIHELIDSANKEAEARKAADKHAAAAAAAAAAALITPPANPDKPMRSIEGHHPTTTKKPRRTLLWTEKYRARTFMDLCGDDLTNRQVLRWLKRWDPIVFPHAASARKAAVAGLRRLHQQQQQQQQQQSQQQNGQQQQQQQQPDETEKPHRKILMLHGPPGLGKTTLAHVCARQAGYEVLEINASDERSKDVVKGRIRTSLGTESVKTVGNKAGEPGKQKVARPVCVVVDEVDGVVGGSGGSGEGGFVKALIDLVLLDQKNSAAGAASSGTSRRKKKGDDFRQMRPLILVCNDVYHPSLRPLRQSGLAEVIHVGKPPVEAVVTRLKTIFEKEGIPCEKDAARKICEAAWGMSSGIDAKRGAESNAEGDLRGVMVVGEWVASRLRASTPGTPTLTRQWVDKHVLHDLSHGGGGARGLGRGGVKEIVSRIFQQGAGFPTAHLPSPQQPQPPTTTTRHEHPRPQLTFADAQKAHATARLREMVETSGETDRIVTDIFLEYPLRDFNDDSFLSKPDQAYEWLHFHDACASRVFSAQEWELAPYVSQPILACHHLFASARRYQPPAAGGRWGDNNMAGGDGEGEGAPVPFSGPRADFAAFEAEKANRAALQALHAGLPAALGRAFRGPEDVATDFLPYLVRLVAPDVKPVVVGGSGDKNGGGAVASVRREGEKAMVRRAAATLAEVGVGLVRGRIEGEVVAGRGAQWVYRMEPDLDALATFDTSTALLASHAPTRYAVRQVLDQELHKTLAAREAAARQARLTAGGPLLNPSSQHSHQQLQRGRGDEDKENQGVEKQAVKRDFFGRVVVERPLVRAGEEKKGGKKAGGEAGKVWVTYHEGLNNAVRKPISLEEFMRGF